MQSRAILMLVRHGETSANLEGVWHGSTDTPLTERGLEQAARVARRLGEHHPAAVYTSHLRRALDTARVIAEALGQEPRIDEALREYDLGRWEGKTFSELSRDHQLWDHMRVDPDFAPHGGESPRQVTSRFTGALRRIADRHPGERVVVVAHGGVLSLALADLVDGDYTKWKRAMSNCAVSELVLDPVPALLSFDDTSHLDGL